MKKSKKAVKRKVRWSSLPCPECGKKGPLLQYIFGNPGWEPDYTKFIVGGCVMGFNQPEIGCRDCGYSGTKEDLEPYLHRG